MTNIHAQIPTHLAAPSRFPRLRRTAIGLALLAGGLSLSACGNTMGDRAGSGAGIGAASGAAIGAIFGGIGALPGALIGAGVGAGTGAVTTQEQIDLGQPVWRR